MQPSDNARAFDSFFRRQHDGLLRFLRRRTPTGEDAEDAAQESWTRLLRYRDSEPASAWKPLLYRIATNVARDRFRHARTHREDKHVPLDEGVASVPDATYVSAVPSPEEHVARRRELARLSEAILRLPPKCRRVFLLKRVYGLTRREIAERCGISVKTVEKHLATALAKLKRQVGERP